jgi:hypothetical protein
MLRVYGVAVRVVEELGPAIARIAVRDPDLARQMRRAASSVVLNVAEGSGCSGGTRRERYRSALAPRARCKRVSMSRGRGGMSMCTSRGCARSWGRS